MQFRHQLALDRKSWYSGRFVLALTISIAFALQPALTLAFSIFLVWKNPIHGYKGLLLIVILGSAYLSLINVTKIPENDLENYINSFNDAKYLELVEYFLVTVREPIYYGTVYIIANISGSDERVYVFLSTFIPYLVLGKAIVTFARFMRIDKRIAACILLISFFMPQLFSLSAHILRQFLAASLITFFIVASIVNARRNHWIAFLGVMNHYSALLIYLISMARPSSRFSQIVNAALYAAMLLLFFMIARFFSPMMGVLPVIGIIFQRIEFLSGIELTALSPLALVFAVAMSVISLVVMVIGSESKKVKDCFPLLYSVLALSLLVLLSGIQPSMTEIATRYFFYIYFLVPILAILVISLVRIPRALIYSLCLISPITFFVNLLYGQWSYAPVFSLLTSPFWVIWGGRDALYY